MKSLEPVLPIIRSHHERWDGTGYPDGLRGRQIPLLARVVQMADIYDSLTCPRPYKQAVSAQDALDVMCRETDRGWRDPEIMAIFQRLHPGVIAPLSEYHSGDNRNLRKMRGSMRSLQRFLAKDAGSARSSRSLDDRRAVS
jgi:putative two-component system response regulator